MTDGSQQQSAVNLIFTTKSKLSIIRQSEATECGLACLAMVLNYFGNHTSLLTLRQKFSVSLSGMNLIDLMDFSERSDLIARPLRIELEQLNQVTTPCILHWDLNHFVVLKKCKRNHVIIHDPAIGERRLSYEEVSKHFTGVLLELAPSKKFKTQKAPPALKFSHFWHSISGLKRTLGLIFGLSILLQIFTLASPYYIQLVIDDAVLSGDTNLLLVLAFGFFLILAFEICTNALRSYTLLRFGNLLNFQLGRNLFHHLIRLPMSYFEKRHIGDIVSRFGSLQKIREMLTTGIIESVIDGLMAIVTLVMIFIYSPLLSVAVLSAVLLYTLVRVMLYRPLKEVSEQEIRTRAEENSNFMETVRGIQSIKLFGSEQQREAQWQNHYSDSINKSIKLGRFNISYEIINRSIFGLENIAVIYLAATLIISGGFSVGMLFAFLAYKTQFMQKSIKLVEKLIEFKMLGLHLERLADMVLTDQEKIESVLSSKHTIMGKITLENVSYRYSEKGDDVIQNFYLTVNPGESIAIVGPSGSGKSTLLKLMLGLIAPTSGSIEIDGIPLAKLGHRTYRQQIAAVMQDDNLLSGSIADNIAFYDASLDMKRVVECATIAAIHDDIIKMPMGYNSLIGDMGSILSGGQKQRIILARALYKNPKILFMDEATSHLDTELENIINTAVQQLAITRVIIAHRKETIASADRVVEIIPSKSTKEMVA